MTVKLHTAGSQEGNKGEAIQTSDGCRHVMSSSYRSSVYYNGVYEIAF